MGKLEVCLCMWSMDLVKLFLIKSQGYLVKMFMDIYSTLILSTETASLADSHTPHLRVYCVPAACAPALAATFPDAFAPHPGPKTSGHPAWPGATPGMTPARPHHTSTHKNNIYGRNHNQKTTTIYIQPQTVSSRIRKPPDTHRQRRQHHIQHRKREREEKNRKSWSTTTALLQC